jgi:hypothetical protein
MSEQEGVPNCCVVYAQAMAVVLILTNSASLTGKKRGLICGPGWSWKVIYTIRLMRHIEMHIKSRLLYVMSSWLMREDVEECNEEDFKGTENSMGIPWVRTSQRFQREA